MYGTLKTGVLSAISAVPTTSISGNYPIILMKSPKMNPLWSIAMPVTKGALQQASLLFTSIHNMTNVLGGMTAWKKAGFRIEK